ncbi:type II secretion system F family protein [Microbacterium sp. YY-03]|uniref:type II secretion system F family protein n=1 Tax=Microbacterium sp. YY-03 TaxID=3421636 RepID=UPI003D16A315
MTWILGLVLGAGLVLAASPWLWPAAAEPRVRERRAGWLDALAVEAGVPRLNTGLIVLLSVAGALVAGALSFVLTRLVVVGLVAAVAGLVAPVMILRGARQRRLQSRRALWPDVCDLLVASTRSGMSLPESVASLADVGPELLRPSFQRFRSDFAASGHFDSSVARLKDELADATADRIIETLRMARQVGGTELPQVLRSLSAAVRADVAARGEVAAKQSWVRAAAIIAVIAPWAILGLLSLRPEAARAYATPGGFVLVVATAVISVVAYRLMSRIGQLPEPRRWFGS